VILLGLRGRTRRSHSALARRWGTGGLLGGVGGAIVLQQQCVAALSPAVLALAAGGGLLGLIILSLLVPVRHPVPPPPIAAPPIAPPPIAPPTPPPPQPAPPPPAPPPPAPPAPEPPQDPKVRTVYRFVASAKACRACQNHATHRLYDSAASIAADRPHPGCSCSTTPQEVDTASYTAYFSGGRTVHDDRRV
jgi:outer membrane biosynthesis protein TonB